MAQLRSPLICKILKNLYDAIHLLAKANSFLTSDIKIDGDPLEKEMWDMFIQHFFPNYELFWREFVVPKTNRPYDIRTKEDTPLEEKKIIMINYGVLSNFESILYALRDLRNWDIIYIRLASIVDQVEDILLKMYQLKKPQTITPLKDQLCTEKITEISKDLNNKVNSKVGSILQDHFNTDITSISKSDILNKINDSPFQEAYRNLKILADTIRPVRNKIIHSWPLTSIIKSGRINIIKKEYIKSGKDHKGNRIDDWQRILSQCKDDNTYQEEVFVDAEKQLKDDIKQLAFNVNKIWGLLLTLNGASIPAETQQTIPTPPRNNLTHFFDISPIRGYPIKESGLDTGHSMPGSPYDIK